MTTLIPATRTHGGVDLALRKLNRSHVFLFNGLLPLADFFSLLLAAYFSARISPAWLAGVTFDRHSWNEPYLALLAALLAPVLLHDKRFAILASRGRRAALVRCYLTGFVAFAGAISLISLASRALEPVPPAVMGAWLASGFILTALTRVVLAANVRRLVRRGVLIEVVAMVGAGPLADRLTQHLRQTRPITAELLGVFDDVVAPGASVTGSIDDLIELGKRRDIDWIFLTLPAAEEERMLSIVRRLKALAVTVALCPPNIGLRAPYHRIDYVGDDIPVTLLVDRPLQRWRVAVKSAGQFLPRWITTLLLMPVLLAALTRRNSHAGLWEQGGQAEPLRCEIDGYDLPAFVDVARRFGMQRYGYVITPNVDQLIRLHDDSNFREICAQARYVLLDSQFLAHLLRVTRGSRLPVCAGSDLTANVFAHVVEPNDRIVIIGGQGEQIRQLVERHGMRNVVHLNPPMGFIRDPQAVEECLRFIEAHSPFRFCVLAVGSPQQEIIAQRLQARGVARGLTLCVGASIDFMTGAERRAPVWMRRCGLEWLMRLMQNPARMANRYLVRGPRVFRLLRRTTFVVRSSDV